MQSGIFEKPGRELPEFRCFGCRGFRPSIERVNLAEANRSTVFGLDFFSFAAILVRADRRTRNDFEVPSRCLMLQANLYQ
jgi:hypothetical protein